MKNIYCLIGLHKWTEKDIGLSGCIRKCKICGKREFRISRLGFNNIVDKWKDCRKNKIEFLRIYFKYLKECKEFFDKE